MTAQPSARPGRRSRRRRGVATLGPRRPGCSRGGCGSGSRRCNGTAAGCPTLAVGQLGPGADPAGARADVDADRPPGHPQHRPGGGVGSGSAARAARPGPAHRRSHRPRPRQRRCRWRGGGENGTSRADLAATRRRDAGRGGPCGDHRAPAAISRRTPDRALAMLSTGIDNAYHFAMYLEQRLTATGSAAVGRQRRRHLASASATTHSGSTRRSPSWRRSPSATPETPRVSSSGTHNCNGWCSWPVAVLVTGALLQSLPDHVPASLLVPALAVTWSLLLGVPGALNLIQGHLSFLLAACAPVVIFLLGRSLATPHADRVRRDVRAGDRHRVVDAAASARRRRPSCRRCWRSGSGKGRPVRWATLASPLPARSVAVSRFVFPWLFGAGLQAVVRDGTVPRVGLPTMTALLLGTVVLLVVLRRRHPASGLGPHLLLAGVVRRSDGRCWVATCSSPRVS